MKRRQSRRTPSADLLVCFPPRTHLATIPIPSPVSDPNPTRRRRRSNSIGGSGGIENHTRRPSGGDGGKTNRHMGRDREREREYQLSSEPSSPRVTCSGQVKGRRRSGSCRGWNSVMHEIEKIHVQKKEKKKKRSSWGDSFGIKKDVFQFLSCLRSFRFDFRCFGSLHGTTTTAISSDDDDDDDEEEEDGGNGDRGDEDVVNSRDVLSRWLMVLDENVEDIDQGSDEKVQDEECGMEAPPANALLLMRCRSAPGRGWGDERREKLDVKKENGKRFEKGKVEMKEKEKERESLEILMKYDAGFGKLSSDIAKETWVLGGFQDPLSRSRSWKR